MLVMGAVNALVTQTASIERAVTALGLSKVDFEGSDSPADQQVSNRHLNAVTGFGDENTVFSATRLDPGELGDAGSRSAAPEHGQNIHRGNGDLAGNTAFATGDRGNAGHDFQLAVAHPSGNISNRTPCFARLTVPRWTRSSLQRPTDHQNTGLNGTLHAMQIAFFDHKEVPLCDPVAPYRHPRH